MLKTFMLLYTYTNQSTAQRRDTSCTGTLMAERTINIRTKAALGTLALAMLAAVAVNLQICPGLFILLVLMFVPLTPL